MQLNTALFSPKVNVVITARHAVTGRLLARRRTHNVFTDTGAAWVATLLGASSLAGIPAVDPVPHVNTKIAYMGFGCGGYLQSDARFVANQTELVTVTALEDPVPFSALATPGEATFLKKVNPQTLGTTYFPQPGRTVMVCEVLESEITYAQSTTRSSGVNVGTSVPISEIGLYLSDAGPVFNTATLAGSDPAQPNSLVAYNIFEPIPLTPNVVVRAEWELRVG